MEWQYRWIPGCTQGHARECRAGVSDVSDGLHKEDHLQRDGLREIVGIAYQINLGRRRHSQSILLKVLDEVKG